ncbi:MAG: hypothetical protein AAF564_26450 [Bacteroidota bacterium]
MLSIFDNIIAIMIAGVVILLLFTIQQRSTDFNIEQNSVYSSKKFSLDFAEWLEGDFSLAGTNMDNGDILFSNLVYEGINTKEITFFRDTLNIDPVTFNVDSVRVETRYTLDSSKVLTLPDTTIQLYEVTRYMREELAGGGFSAWNEVGKGPEWVSYFRVNTLNDQGQTVLLEPQTAFFDIAFTLALPNFSSTAYLREFNWATTVNIRRY